MIPELIQTEPAKSAVPGGAVSPVKTVAPEPSAEFTNALQQAPEANVGVAVSSTPSSEPQAPVESPGAGNVFQVAETPSTENAVASSDDFVASAIDHLRAAESQLRAVPGVGQHVVIDGVDAVNEIVAFHPTQQLESDLVPPQSLIAVLQVATSAVIRPKHKPVDTGDIQIIDTEVVQPDESASVVTPSRELETLFVETATNQGGLESLQNGKGATETDGVQSDPLTADSLPELPSLLLPELKSVDVDDVSEVVATVPVQDLPSDLAEPEKDSTKFEPVVGPRVPDPRPEIIEPLPVSDAAIVPPLPSLAFDENSEATPVGNFVVPVRAVVDAQTDAPEAVSDPTARVERPEPATEVAGPNLNVGVVAPEIDIPAETQDESTLAEVPPAEDGIHPVDIDSTEVALGQLQEVDTGRIVPVQRSQPELPESTSTESEVSARDGDALSATEIQPTVRAKVETLAQPELDQPIADPELPLSPPVSNTRDVQSVAIQQSVQPLSDEQPSDIQDERPQADGQPAAVKAVPAPVQVTRETPTDSESTETPADPAVPVAADVEPQAVVRADPQPTAVNREPASVTKAPVETPAANSQSTVEQAPLPTPAPVASVVVDSSARTPEALTPQPAPEPVPAHVSSTVSGIQRVLSGDARIQIQLDPPELGTMLVDVTRSSDGVVARLEVATTAAHRAVSESLSDLQQSLSKSGMTVDRVEVVLSENRSESSRQGQTSRDGRPTDQRQQGQRQNPEQQRRDDQQPDDERIEDEFEITPQ